MFSVAAKKSQKPKGKTGRPPKITDEVLEQARALMAPPRSLSVEEAAAELKVGKTQLYARLQVSTTATPVQAASVAKVGPATTKLPQGGEVADRPDLLALVRRVLGARDPAALRELDDGLEVFTRGGEEALAPWLSRPLAGAAKVDPLDACLAGLAAAVAHAEALSPLHPKAPTVLGALAGLAQRVENIAKGRPKAPTRDEVQEAVRGAMDSCVEFVLKPTREAAAKLVRDRAALLDGLDVGPATASEIGRRVDAMLGGA